MCGICGIVATDPTRPMNPAALSAMRHSLAHRGPDDSGQYLAPGVGLGSTRLAVIDLSTRAHMPMCAGDGRYWITYNGEVYNHQELRTELESLGCVFRSQSDTEVVLQAYVVHGPGMLDRLNGMFAIAIWDSYERRLFLARDRLGVKPLYYAEHDGCLYFGSEEKALFAAGLSPRFNPTCTEELLCFRYVAGEQTPFTGVKRLEPGHYLLWNDGRIHLRRWWNLAEKTRERRGCVPHGSTGWLRETFDEAVNLRQISDVPIGVLLSGGLDSSSVAASLALQTDGPVAAFTVRFEERGWDEGPQATDVVERWHLQSHELRLHTTKLFEELQTAAHLQDEPLAHGNEAHILAISRFAKPRVTVLLSGEGADELLGGYVRYWPLRYPKATSMVRPLLLGTRRLASHSRLRKLGRFLALRSFDDLVLFNACDVLPDDLRMLGFHPSLRHPFREHVLDEARALYPGDYVRQAMYSDQHTFLCSLLDRNDRMTMGASIECRVPFLDYRLVEGLAALPTSRLLAGFRSKPLLRRAIGCRLPDAVLRHRKWGFGVPWLKYFQVVPEFRDLLATLPDVPLFQDMSLSRASIRRLLAEFDRGDAQHGGLIQQLVMLAVWAQTFRAHTGARRTHYSLSSA